MNHLPGAFQSKKKDGTLYYRSSITYKNKHISLGSFLSELEAHQAYLEAKEITSQKEISYLDYPAHYILSFEKWIILLNFKYNNVYVKNPIFMHKSYFSYFLNRQTELKFDVDDLFYYSNHKIFSKGSYLFVNDYGMQINILSRYKIKNHAVEGKDYFFADGDNHNFRYENLININPYYGVQKEFEFNNNRFLAKIHINGDYIIGRYRSMEKAAIAYNKIADFLNEHHISSKEYPRNYISSLNSIEYSEIYNKIRIDEKFFTLIPNKKETMQP